jgi:biotin/methionine sulfoxide reductase
MGSPAAARFPLYLIANQPATRLHSQLDFGAISLGSKIRGREPVRIHPQDAAARALPLATLCASTTTAAPAWLPQC